MSRFPRAYFEVARSLAELGSKKEGSLGSVALPRLSGAPARIDKAVLQG